MQGSTNLEAIQIIKKAGGSLKDSFLDEGYGLIALLFFHLWFHQDHMGYAPIQHDHLVATRIPNLNTFGHNICLHVFVFSLFFLLISDNFVLVLLMSSVCKLLAVNIAIWFSVEGE